MNKELKTILDKDKRLNNPRILMFANLQLIRFFELLISDKYEEQIFRCPVHLSIGQEAIAVGVSMNLSLTDKVISTHRSHAHYIAKGGDPSAMLRNYGISKRLLQGSWWFHAHFGLFSGLFGKRTDCW